MTPKNISEIEKLFDEKFPPFAEVDADNVFIDRKGFPVLLNDEVKQFWLEHFRSLIESLKMEEKTQGEINFRVNHLISLGSFSDVGILIGKAVVIREVNTAIQTLLS